MRATVGNGSPVGEGDLKCSIFLNYPLVEGCFESYHTCVLLAPGPYTLVTSKTKGKHRNVWFPKFSFNHFNPNNATLNSRNEIMGHWRHWQKFKLSCFNTCTINFSFISYVFENHHMR